MYGNPWGQFKVQGAASAGESGTFGSLRMGRGIGAWLFWPLRRLGAHRGTLFPWVLVLLAVGIGAWFSWPVEPGAGLYAAVGGAALAGLALWWRGPDLGQPLGAGLLCLALGFLAAGARAHLVAGPMLDFRYYGPVTGRVIEVDRSQSDVLRVTLDRVVIERTAPDRLPLRVRIALHAGREAAPRAPPLPGQVVMTTAHLAAPQGPAEPGGFDFRRMAYFDGLGAVGYTSVPLVLWQDPEPGTQIINRLRGWISRGMLAAMPGQAGAFATGAMTGDRSAITEATSQALRDSSLAHLLAISGMNMAFLVAFVFALIRYGLALVPPLALRVNSKKLAAVVALAVGLFYLLLSGANVATERAFLMVSVMLIAVLLDRRAMTMRSVAISGTILLLWQPETLLEPGFQMSFAATVALVAGFGALDRSALRARLPGWTMPGVMAVLSSALGGAATAPIAAAHFNRFADLGFVANLLTAPAMGLLIMPGGVMAALLWPLGLSAPALWLMQAGSAWILAVAGRVAAVEGAVTGIAMPAPWVIPVLGLGFAWAVLARGGWRGLAILPGVIALLSWADADQRRPDLIVSADGTLAGLMGPGGRALSAPRGAGFSAASWLENDGDLADQAGAAARPGFDGPPRARRFRLGDWQGVVLTGAGAAAAVPRACADLDLVVTSADLAQAPAFVRGDCQLIDAGLLRTTGPLTLRLQKDGRLLLTPAQRGGRIWMAPGPGGPPRFLQKPGLLRKD